MKSKILLFTAVEVGAVSSLLVDETWVMIALVGLGFLVEHVISWNAKNPGVVDDTPMGELAIVAAVESVVWIAWIFMVMAGQDFQAAAVLIVGLLLGHILERNVSAGLHLFEDPIRRIKESWDFTLLEAAAGIGWLLLLDVHWLPAVLVLGSGLTLEHEISCKRGVEIG